MTDNRTDSELSFYLHRNRLSKTDRELLRSIEPIVGAVAEVFGRNCEVILHSLEDPAHSVVKIENKHITNRTVGSPLTDLAIKILMEASGTEEDVIGSYYTRTNDDKLLKSVTALIKNATGKPIGMLCINVNISAGFGDFIQDFVPGQVDGNKTDGEHFVSDMQELVTMTLKKALQEVGVTTGLSSREKNRVIIQHLYTREIFSIKGAVDTVAEGLGLSKYTIYGYLRTIREQ